MRYGYYERLRPRQRAIYRKSDAVTKLPLPDAESMHPAIASLRDALHSEERRAIGKAARAIVRALCTALGVSVPTVRVLARRPSNATSELHGLYERDEDGKAVIRVWMRTAAHERVVAFRTFLRTLLHEVCHHLDFDLLQLADSFHTQGFFRRESSLVRQLAPKEPAAESVPPPPPDPEPPQLILPGLS